MNPNLQGSFGKLDHMFTGYVTHPSCPAIVGTIYFKIKGFASGIVDV